MIEITFGNLTIVDRDCVFERSMEHITTENHIKHLESVFWDIAEGFIDFNSTDEDNFITIAYSHQDLECTISFPDKNFSVRFFLVSRSSSRYYITDNTCKIGGYIHQELNNVEYPYECIILPDMEKYLDVTLVHNLLKIGVNKSQIQFVSSKYNSEVMYYEYKYLLEGNIPVVFVVYIGVR